MTRANEEIWRLVDTLAFWSRIYGSALTAKDEAQEQMAVKVLYDTRNALSELGIKPPR